MKWLLKLLGIAEKATDDEINFAYEFASFIRAEHTLMDVVEVGPNWIDLKDQTDPKRIFRITITHLKF